MSVLGLALDFGLGFGLFSNFSRNKNYVLSVWLLKTSTEY